MRLPFVSLFLSAALFAANAYSQITNSVNIVYNVANFLGQPQILTSVSIQAIPTNGVFNQNLETPYFPPINRATYPSLTNGTFTLSNAAAGLVYKTTFQTMGGPSTYWILAPSGLANGTTILAWSNVVVPAAPQADGLFSFSTVASDARYMPKVIPSVSNYVATAIDTNGDFQWMPSQGGIAGAVASSAGKGTNNTFQSPTNNNAVFLGNTLIDNGNIFSDGLGDLTIGGLLTVRDINPGAAISAVGINASGQLTTNNVPGSGGQNQTPWAQDINMAGRTATNGNSASYSNQVKALNILANGSITNNGTMTVVGASSMDNGAISSDGNGNLSVANFGSSGASGLDNGTIVTDGRGDMSLNASGSLLTAKTINTTHLNASSSVAVDNGQIISDGSGDLTAVKFTGAFTGNGANLTNIAGTNVNAPIILDQWQNTADSANTHSISLSNNATGKVAATARTNGSMAFDNGKITTDGNGNITGTSMTAPSITVSNSGNTGVFTLDGTLALTNSLVQKNQLLKTLSSAGVNKVIGLVNNIGALVDNGTTPSYSTTFPSTFTTVFGAAQNYTMQYLYSSSASQYELPTHENDIKQAMPKPVLGVISDDSRATEANPLPIQTNFLYLLDIARYFNTSGVAGVLSNNGSRAVFLGDDGWQQTNRDSSGNLQVLPGLFAAGISNTMYYSHTNGMGVILANYYSTIEPSVGDTDFRCDVSGANQNSYPSGAAGSGVTYTFPMTVPDKVALDVKWYYTNFIDGVLIQDDDTTFQGMANYFHSDDVQFADAVLYPTTSDAGRVYWKLYNYLNNTPPGHIDSALSASQFQIAQLGGTLFFPHQLWVGHFENHLGIEAQYYCNFTTPDQNPAQVGTDTGLKIGMAYVHNYDQSGMSNWNGGNFPFMSLDSLGNTSTTYSNYYAIVGEFNACSFNMMTTNPYSSTVLAGGWETNQTPIVTNSGFISVWTDVEHYPRTVFDDYTNTVRIRKYGNAGQFVVLGVNQGASTSNYNVSLCALDSSPYGSIGITAGAIYVVTNVYEGTFVGYLTNNFITNLVNATKTWVTLTPFNTFNNAYTNQFEAAPSTATSGNIPQFNGASNILSDSQIIASTVVTNPNTVVSGNIATFNGTSGKQIQDSGIIAANVITNLQSGQTLHTLTVDGTFSGLDNGITNISGSRMLAKSNDTAFNPSLFGQAYSSSGGNTSNGAAYSNIMFRGLFFQQRNPRLPPRGEASWFRVGTGITTSYVATAIGEMRTNLPGYNWLELDDGLFDSNRVNVLFSQLNSNLQATYGAGTNGVYNFITAMVSSNINLIIYADGGTNLSASQRQVSFGGQYLVPNIDLWTRWGAKGLKLDMSEIQQEQAAYVMTTNGYPVYMSGAADGNFSVNNNGALNRVYPSMFNAPRVVSGGDVTSWTNLIQWMDVAETNGWFNATEPGRFIDLDFTGGGIGTYGQNALKGHIIAIAMSSAPELQSTTTAQMLPWATNADIQNIQQDAGVFAAHRVYQASNCDVYLKPLATQNGPQYAVAVFNRGTAATGSATNLSFYFTNLPPLAANGIQAVSVFNCVSNGTDGSSGSYVSFVPTNYITVSLNTNDAALYRLIPGTAMQTNVVSVNWPDSEVMNVISNGVPIPTLPQPWDSDASNYVQHAGITNNPTEMLASASLVTALKNNALPEGTATFWNAMDSYYPFEGGTATSVIQDLKQKHNLTAHGTVTNGFNFVSADGSTGYFDTGFTPTGTANAFQTNSASILVLNRLASPAAGNQAMMSAIGPAFLGETLFLNGSSSTVTAGGINVNNIGPMSINWTLDGDTGNASGWWLSTRTGASSQAEYHDAVLGATDTSTATGFTTSSLTILARNSGSIDQFYPGQIGFAAFGQGLSGGDWNILRNILTQFETVLTNDVANNPSLAPNPIFNTAALGTNASGPSGITLYVGGKTMVSSNMLFATNTTVPTFTAGFGTLSLSNYDLYWITPTKTNLVILGH